MKVSVVVSTYTIERKEDMLRCIGSLSRQTLKPFEILLVLDPLDELVEYYTKLFKNEGIEKGVEITRSSGFGLSIARNTGVKNAKGDIIAFIDDDAWADERWLENMVKNYEDERVWGVGGKIIPVFDAERPKWLPEELDWIVGCTYKGMPETKTEIRNPIGANMSFRNEAFEVAGLFRTEVGRYGRKLLGSEETEFSMRLRQLKPDVKIVYDPSAVVYHRVPVERASIRYALKRAYYEGYSKAVIGRSYRLSTEEEYFKLLLKNVLQRVVKPNRYLEIFGILAVVFSVVAGNITAKFHGEQFTAKK